MVKHKLRDLNSLYGALADPTRREMISRLRRGPLSISDLGAPFGMTLAAIGKHVAALESAGIVQTHKTGRVRRCALVPRGLSPAASWLTEQEQFWNERLDSPRDPPRGEPMTELTIHPPTGCSARARLAGLHQR